MSELKKHIGRAHTVQCLPCIPSKQRMNRGGRVHKYERTETGEYKCPYCTETRARGSTMSEHVNKKHPVEAGRLVMGYICEYEDCGRGFSTKSDRLHHIKNHHEIRLISCPYEGCNHPAKNQGALQTHYARKHLDRNKCIMQLRDDEYGCFKCETREMKEPSTWYHASGCHPESPFRKPF